MVVVHVTQDPSSILHDNASIKIVKIVLGVLSITNYGLVIRSFCFSVGVVVIPSPKCHLGPYFAVHFTSPFSSFSYYMLLSL